MPIKLVLFTCLFVLNILYVTIGQAMGITDFINPSDPGKPLHEVSGFTILNIKPTSYQIGLSTILFNRVIFFFPTHGPTLLQRIREITEGGVDYSFECIGNSDILREAFLSTHEVLTLI